MKPLILIQSQDADFFLILSHILEVDGFRVKLVGDVDETIQAATQDDPAGVVLDCRPDSDSSRDACTRIKRDPLTSGIAVAALVSPGAESKCVDLIKAGLDECLIRPVTPVKLLDFLRAGLSAEQRNSIRLNPDKLLLNYSDIEMHIGSRRVHRNGTEIHLGAIEFNILRYLLQYPGRVFSRDELIQAAWPEDVRVDKRTVDVHIGRLRRQLRLDSNFNIIRTIRSAGYALDEQVR